MLSNLSNETTDQKTGVTASWFLFKYSLRLGFCTAPINMQYANTTYISSAVTSCHSFILERLEKLLPLDIWTALHSGWSESQYSTPCSEQKIIQIYLQR